MKRITSEELMIDYMRDESRKSGYAEEVLFPETEAELIEILRKCPDVRLTVQGSRTGLTAGCVPFGGKVISFERMNRILEIKDIEGDSPGSDVTDREGPAGGDISRDMRKSHTAAGKISDDPAGMRPAAIASVQPGLPLQVFREELRRKKLVFTPDPTETSASIGGMISCNSSGARSYKYGATREHVRSIKVVLRNGDALRLTRGVEKARGLEFELFTEKENRIAGRLPDIRMPDVSKHTAGYFIRPDMDMIDLFIGSEGTLGIITEAELFLYHAPEHTWGCVVFFHSESDALDFVTALREAEGTIYEDGFQMPGAEAIEYFDIDTLDLIRNEQMNGGALQDSETVPENSCAVYIEHIADSRDALMDVYRRVMDILIRSGSAPEDTWMAINTTDLNKLKEFRHAAPVSVNHLIAEIKKTYPEITKLGTDMSVRDGDLQDVAAMYREGLAAYGFRSAVFGHIGNDHLHVNIIPRNMEEYAKGKELYTGWAEKIVGMGGSVSAEHGIGKLKKWLFQKMYPPEQLDDMRRLRRIFDPDELLDQGNLFEPGI